MKRLAVIGISLLLALLALGCGEETGPSSVSAADLSEEGAFWLDLDEDLRRELAGICRDQQIKEASAPEEFEFLRSLDTDDFVAEMNKSFEGDAEGTIEDTCEAAKAELAQASFEQLAPQLSGE